MTLTNHYSGLLFFWSRASSPWRLLSWLASSSDLKQCLVSFLAFGGQLLLTGLSERSILVTTLTSSLVFTVTNILAEIVFKAVNGQNQVFLDNIVVAYMVADMEVDKVADMMADMVADIEVDMVADIDINMEIQFGERVGHGCWLIGPNFFFPKPTRLAHPLSLWIYISMALVDIKYDISPGQGSNYYVVQKII